MDLNALAQNASTTLINVAWKVAGAVALWLIGRWLISLALDMIGRAAAKQQFDVTLTRYLQTALKILLNIALIVAILGFFGVETTTFAALLAAGGVAIGVAWGGLLANFAVGYMTTGGYIQNYSTNPYRRVDLTATISNTVDHRVAIRAIKQHLSAIPNVLASPEPQVDVLQFTPAGPVLCVRSFCSNENYWQVYFDTNRMIRETFTEAGFPVPTPTFAVSASSIGSPFVEH